MALEFLLMPESQGKILTFVQVFFLRGGSAATLSTWSRPVKGSTILLQLCLLPLESADAFATWSRQVGERAKLLQLCLLPVESAVAFFDTWSRPVPEVTTKLQNFFFNQCCETVTIFTVPVLFPVPTFKSYGSCSGSDF
jgi:hypothetical protein